MKNVLHCNENPIYVFSEKELHDLSPAAPAAAHVDALGKCKGDRSEFAIGTCEPR
jgi:hypothetical protein